MTDHQRLNQLKTKQEMDQYDITIDHKEVLSLFYDYYMEFSPTSVKRIFLLFFPLNKLFKLLLVYCLFYHSIWWLPNSTSNNLAINYSNINSFAFIILLYFNFYELLISFLFIRSICFNCLNRLRLIPVVRLKSYLNLIELLLYSFFNLIIFYYFKFILNISFKLLFLIQLPHLLIYFHNNFDISLKLFNFNIFSNESFIKKLNQNEYHQQQQQQELPEVVSCKSTSLTYTDCSNLSIKTFLNQPLAMPTLLTSFNQIKQTQKLNPATNPSEQSNQTLKIIKQSVNRAKTAKSRAINLSIILFELPRQLMTNTKLKLNNLYQSTIKSFKSFVLNIPKANRITIKKRNIFDYNFTNDSTTYIQHLCQKNAMGLREECNWFSFEFKNRFKQTLIYTFESIYYNFFITRLFVPTDVYIRENDYAMYLTSSLISTFISYWLYYIPFSFLKKLSNNAEHLGYWCRVADDDKLPTTKWINTKNYYYGDRVVYMGKIYEANTNHCAAVPSNRFYYIYYLIFANPARTVRILLCFKLLNILILLLLIYLNRRWYAIALSILEVICNSHLFFILMRDFFIFYDGQNYKYKKFK